MTSTATSTFEINRSNLLTGAALKAILAAGEDAPGYHHRKSGLRCTLGQYAQTGGPDLKVDLAEDIADANDNLKLHQTRREAKIVKLFAKANILACFTGRYADATMKAKRSVKR